MPNFCKKLDPHFAALWNGGFMELLFSSIQTLFVEISNVYIHIGSFSFSVLDMIIFNIIFGGLLYMINVFLHIND